MSLTMKKYVAELEKLTINCSCPETKKQLQGLLKNAKAEGSNADVTSETGSDQAGGEEDSEEEEDSNYKSKDFAKGKVHIEEGKMSKNAQMTDEEWLERAPFRIRQAVTNAMQIEQREREHLVAKLVANVEDADTKADMAKEFLTYDLRKLRQMVKILPRETNNTMFAPPQGVIPNYMGAAAPATNARTEEEKNDILPLPTANWMDEYDVSPGLKRRLAARNGQAAVAAE